jgi:hypothetical protein
VASTLKLPRNGAVGFNVWLDGLGEITERSLLKMHFFDDLVPCGIVIGFKCFTTSNVHRPLLFGQKDNQEDNVVILGSVPLDSEIGSLPVLVLLHVVVNDGDGLHVMLDRQDTCV